MPDFEQPVGWIVSDSRPGYLRTPLSSGRTPEDQADLYGAVLDALDIERAAVLGFSSGGPSAVHFAARYPERATALLLDTAILLPYQPPISALQRATFESGFFIWLSYQMITHRPLLTAQLMIDGLSTGLNSRQKKSAAAWITSDPVRLRSLQDQSASVAPKRYRQAGWINDQANETHLTPLPFRNVTTPTLIAHGTNDAVVPVEHASNAAGRISGAQLILVEEGHHLLSLSPNYEPVAQRQLELARG